jgi:hypothetical protein
MSSQGDEMEARRAFWVRQSGDGLRVKGLKTVALLKTTKTLRVVCSCL